MYLFCEIMISLWNNAHTHTNWPFIYLREQLDLSVAQIELCLDAKHWDLNVWTFARCIAFFCAKLSPNCIRGILTPKRLVHIFAFNSERNYINLASASASAATAATAATATTTIFQINKGTLTSACSVTSSKRGTKIPTTTCSIFSLDFKRRGIWLHCQFFRFRLQCRFHLRGCIWFRSH